LPPLYQALVRKTCPNQFSAMRKPPCLFQCKSAVINAPLYMLLQPRRSPAQALITRLRRGSFASKLHAKRNSEITAPLQTIRSANSLFSGGYIWLKPLPITAIVRPLASNALLCAQYLSRGKPDTIVNPHSDNARQILLVQDTRKGKRYATDNGNTQFIQRQQLTFNI